MESGNNDLMTICHETRTEVALLNERHKFTCAAIDDMRKQISALSEKSDSTYKTWHIVVLTITYSVISLFPHSQFFDFLFK